MHPLLGSKLLRPVLLLVALIAASNAMAGTLADASQLYKKGKADQALVELDAYLSTLPKDGWGRNVTQARFLKGVILADLKRTDEAIQVFNKLTLDYPGLPEPYNNLAALYVAQGKYEAARDTLERAMLTDPTYATLQTNLSDVYAKLSTQAYESTLRSASGTAAPERIKELCDNYGKMANQSAGRKIAPHADADFQLLRDIPASRTAASQPPAHVDVDEMAMETPASKPMPAAAAKPAAPKADVANREVAKPSDAKTATPVATESKAMPPVDAAPEEKRAILKAVQGWSSAWSGKNVNAYLSYYTPNFKLPGGGTHAAWATQRRERITKPKSIHVGVEAPQVTVTDNSHAHVTFRQTYRSDSLQTTGRKTLVMIKTGGKWLIQEEQVGG